FVIIEVTSGRVLRLASVVTVLIGMRGHRFERGGCREISREGRRLGERRDFGNRKGRDLRGGLATGANYYRCRHGLGAGTRIGCLDVDDVAEQDLPLVELVAPDDDGLKGERALAQTCDDGLSAGLDALGDRDFTLAGEKFH